MTFSIFYTNRFSTSLTGLWVCSNERAPTTPLQQSIRGIIESPPFYLGVRACAHSKIHGFIYLCRLFALFVTCSVVSFCCFFLLGLITNIFDLQHSCARCYFFLTKGIPSHLAIDSVTHIHTHQKFGYANPSWNSCCTHDTIPHRCRHLFWTFLSSFFFFFFLAPFFPSRFF